MGCCGEDSVKVSKMALELKCGQMLHYKRRIFGRNWREVYPVLYNDSTLAWYRDKGQMDQEGGVVIKNAPELMAYGQFTGMIPNRPNLPESYNDRQLLAFGVRGKESVYWFLCPTEQEVESWMVAISNTLPPPPKPQQPQEYSQGPPPVPVTPIPTDAPNGYSDYPPQNPTAPQAPPNTYLAQPDSMRIPGQYPTPTGFRPQYTAAPLQPAYAYASQPRTQPANGNTTVVVQDRRNDGGEFAMGMLVGGAIGAPMGYAWGHGWGWGGGGGGGWHSGPTVHDTDVTINNYYDVDNTVVNNDFDVEASQNIMVADSFGGDSFGGDAFGGGGDCDVGDICAF